LLAAIAASPTDDTPRRVLADFWLEHGDERGLFIQASCEGLVAHCHALLAEHGLHWFEPLWAAGFSPDRLEVERGFPRPLAVRADEALAHDPALHRISPVVYRLEQLVRHDVASETWRATRWSAAGPDRGVVVRTWNPLYPTRVNPIVRERDILERFDHPVIPRILDIAQTATGNALVFDDTEPLPAMAPPQVATLGHALASGLAALHARDVYHGWLERDRIAIGPLGPRIDGFAQARCELERVDIDHGSYDPQPHTYRYLAPEVARGLPTDPQVDVFSLAMILVELAQGFHPIHTASDFETLVAIRDLAFAIAIRETPLGVVLVRALVREPARRPTASVLARQLLELA
jgi:uncharacterized protein (TIGR02996 family)